MDLDHIFYKNTKNINHDVDVQILIATQPVCIKKIWIKHGDVQLA